MSLTLSFLVATVGFVPETRILNGRDSSDRVRQVQPTKELRPYLDTEQIVSRKFWTAKIMCKISHFQSVNVNLVH